jgi:hypothetical protein
VAHGQALGQQRPLEGEGAADEERDKALAPVFGGVDGLVDELAVAPHPVAGEVGAQVGAGRQRGGLGGAGIGDLEHRARLRVAHAEAQEVEGVGLRQSDEVRLGEARGEAGRRPRELAAADRRAQSGGILGAAAAHRPATPRSAQPISQAAA